MRSVSIEFIAFVTACVMAVTAGILGDLRTAQRNQLRAEAVERGYAEWYAEEPGEQPTQWRWKERE